MDKKFFAAREFEVGNTSFKVGQRLTEEELSVIGSKLASLIKAKKIISVETVKLKVPFHPDPIDDFEPQKNYKRRVGRPRKS